MKNAKGKKITKANVDEYMSILKAANKVNERLCKLYESTNNMDWNANWVAQQHHAFRTFYLLQTDSHHVKNSAGNVIR